MRSKTRKTNSTLRRRRWNETCRYCGPAWRDAKSNRMGINGACLFCEQYLCVATARGAAWILRRLVTLDKWTSRLSSTQGAARGGLRAVATKRRARA